jgi:hypothetical protein
MKNADIIKAITKHRGKVMVSVQGTEMYVAVEKADLKDQLSKELEADYFELSKCELVHSDNSGIKGLLFLDFTPYQPSSTIRII